MKVLAWYIEPNGFENKKIPTATHTLLLSNNVKSSLYKPEWY
jgi:hypothetical protein